MKSSTGNYYLGLDHIRAIAAFLVFSWHFMHGDHGNPVPFGTSPSILPLSILDEGHTGVALFMTLSGYLFAKLLDGKQILYKSFIWNRFLRLAPLLIFVLFAAALQWYLHGSDLMIYLKRVFWGAIWPSFPNGAWSITVEFHFYLILPLLLWLKRKSPWSLLGVLCLMIVVRSLVYLQMGKVQSAAYYTIVGRIDQFLLGIMAFQFRQSIRGRHWLVLAILSAFSFYYWDFDRHGGYYNHSSSSSVWILIPTIEGFVYGALVAWYDSSFTHSTNKVSRFIASIGTYSYSIYLLHPFFAFDMAPAIHRWVDISNFYVALLFCFLSFLLMVPVGYLSYRFIESPFLKLRTKYVLSDLPKENDVTLPTPESRLMDETLVETKRLTNRSSTLQGFTESVHSNSKPDNQQTDPTTS